MLRLKIIFSLLMIQLSLTAQYQIIKYQFRDTFENDETYQSLKNKQLEFIKAFNIIRDSIITTKKIPEEDKLQALQLFNNLFDENNDVFFYLKNQDDAFSWFSVSSRKKVEDLVSQFERCIYNCAIIRNAYDNEGSNRYVQSMKRLPKLIDKSIKFLGLHKKDERSSILFKRLHSNIGVDQCLKNKDIYFSDYSFNLIKMIWSQQFYAFRKLKKRNNNYHALVLNDSIESKSEIFDYIIYGNTINLNYTSSDIKLLKRGGRLYVEMKYITEKEYEEGGKILGNVNMDSTYQKIKYESKEIKYERLPHFTREMLNEFITTNGLQIEKAVEEGDRVKYAFLKN